VTGLLSQEIDRLEQLRSRPVLAGSAWLIDSRADELSRYVARGAELMSLQVDRATSRVGELASQLRALSPQRTLDRGYAIAQLPSGVALRAAKDAPRGTPLLLTVADGRLVAVAGDPESTPSGTG
jgi:exodeoxyribonuclease VII large subunit